MSYCLPYSSFDSIASYGIANPTTDSKRKTTNRLVPTQLFQSQPAVPVGLTMLCDLAYSCAFPEAVLLSQHWPIKDRLSRSVSLPSEIAIGDGYVILFA
jgi:hypothetical protein